MASPDKSIDDGGVVLVQPASLPHHLQDLHGIVGGGGGPRELLQGTQGRHQQQRLEHIWAAEFPESLLDVFQRHLSACFFFFALLRLCVRSLKLVELLSDVILWPSQPNQGFPCVFLPSLSHQPCRGLWDEAQEDDAEDGEDAGHPCQPAPVEQVRLAEGVHHHHPDHVERAQASVERRPPLGCADLGDVHLQGNVDDCLEELEYVYGTYWRSNEKSRQCSPLLFR